MDACAWRGVGRNGAGVGTEGAHRRMSVPSILRVVAGLGKSVEIRWTLPGGALLGRGGAVGGGWPTTRPPCPSIGTGVTGRRTSVAGPWTGVRRPPNGKRSAPHHRAPARHERATRPKQGETWLDRERSCRTAGECRPSACGCRPTVLRNVARGSGDVGRSSADVARRCAAVAGDRRRSAPMAGLQWSASKRKRPAELPKRPREV
jgi:hypothetical protein